MLKTQLNARTLSPLWIVVNYFLVSLSPQPQCIEWQSDRSLCHVKIGLCTTISMKCKLSFRCLDVEVLSQVVGRLLKSIRFSFTILPGTVFFKSKQPEKGGGAVYN